MKFPIYRFVKCDGYLEKNKDKWVIDCLDKKYDLVNGNLTGNEKLIAHKGNYIGSVDADGKTSKFFITRYCRSAYEIEKELEWGETVHQENYIYKDDPFDGFLVEVRKLCLSKDIGGEFDDAVDVGVGTIPERYYIGKWNEKFIKVGKVYINKNGQYKLVPIENIHNIKEAL